MQNFFEKLASNLVFAAFIPALIFTIVADLIIGSLIPVYLKQELIQIFKESSVFTLTCALILSFILLYLRELIYSFYRGSSLNILSFLERRRAQKNQMEIRRINASLFPIEEKLYEENLEIDQLSYEERVTYNQLKNKQYKVISRYQSSFPIFYVGGKEQNDEFLSTQFGNILRAAECSCRRFGMDAVHIWPRLIQVIPDKNFQKIEEVSNQMFLLLNFSFLSLLLAVITWSAGFTINLSSQQVIRFVVIGLISLSSFYGFYRLSIPLARNYANMYRGAFDLFRFELLRSMNEELPKDSNEEFDTWKRISEGLAIGEYFYDIYCRYPNHKWHNQATEKNEN